MKTIPPQLDDLWKHLLEQASAPGFFERNAARFCRRAMLAKSFNGMGLLGMAAALGGRASGMEMPGSGPLALKQPHFAPRAKHVIHLWMNGAPSQVDTFDPKPALARYAGQRPESTAKLTTENRTGGLMPSPFPFSRHGRSGLEISSLFPHVARHADDLCVIRSMHTDVPVHESSNWMMFTGSIQPNRPSYGSWLLYGLGSENENLPGFVVLGEPGQPVNGPSNWSSRFLPGIYQGCQVALPPGYNPREVMPYLRNTELSASSQRRELDFLQQLNALHVERRGAENALNARIESLEMAFHMGDAAAEAFDTGAESAATLEAYGLSGPEADLVAGSGDGGFKRATFGRNCLLARRLVERGVRVVQIYCGKSQPWDHHGRNSESHRNHAAVVDRPIAALLADLKNRGLLEETLVLWGGEFGRTVYSQGVLTRDNHGRDHHPRCYSVWMAGAGVKGGHVHGETDDFSYNIVKDPCTSTTSTPPRSTSSASITPASPTASKAAITGSPMCMVKSLKESSHELHHPTTMKNVTFTTQRSLSRRAMLKSTGITLALPWLDAMLPAFAADPKPPMRFIGILNYFSFHAPNLFPKEAGADYIATPYLQGLQRHRKDFTIISGLNHPEVRDGHSSDKSFFTGAPHPGSPSFKNTVSLDQLAAEQIGRETRHASLNFSTSGAFSCSYTRSGVAIPPETSAARAFAKLFIDGTPAEVAEEVARVQEGQSILDRVAGEAKRLQREVSASDRDKLDQYFTSVRELEQRLVRSENFAKQPKPKPGVPAIKDPGPGEDTRRFGLMLEVARLAVQTDLTRIVTLYYVGTSKTPSKPGTSFAYHDLSHHGQDKGKLSQLAILERDLLLEWGGFIGRMKEARDGGSRLLDNTMSVFGAGMGNASSHDSTNLPILIAGGRFKHGQHIAHDPKSPPPLCNLWVQMLQQMGMEVGKFGTSNAETLTGLSV